MERIINQNGDYVYDIEITTNRVDMMSILGISRELSAILPQFGYKTALKQDSYKKELGETKLTVAKKIPQLKVILKNKKLCPRFAAVLLENISVRPSPEIIRSRILLAGMRPLNNIIDVSNYLMHELGQPIHTFDYDKIAEKTMIIRPSIKGEKIVTLDGQSRSLPGNDIIIEDGKKRIIDLCGIMGGRNTAIDSKTKRVLLFVQNYNPTYIRRTSMKLGHRTQAATLFEKNLDPELVLPALKKGVQLIKQNAGAKLGSKILDIYQSPYKPSRVKVPLQLIRQYLGTPIHKAKTNKILSSLGFDPKQEDKGEAFTVTVPSWRSNDIAIAEDLIEEIARIYGYHRLPSLMPVNQPPVPSPQETEFYWEQKIKSALKNWGLTEIYTYSMQSEQEIEKFRLQPENHLKIKNPLSEDWIYMRTHLIPSLLSVVKNNEGFKNDISIFEISNVYIPRKKNLPEEKLKLAILYRGEKFYQLKGLIEALLEEIGILDYKFEVLKKNPHNQWFNPKTASLYLIDQRKSQKAGTLGLISPLINRNFALRSKVTAAYLDFSLLVKKANNNKKYKLIPKYPGIIEDLSFVLKPGVLYEDLLALIRSVDTKINNIELIDLYKKTVTLRITYLHPQKNLTDEEVKKIRKRIILKVKQKGWAKLKGKGTD